MRKLLCTVLSSLIVLLLAFSSRPRAAAMAVPAAREDPRLGRALVFPGGGFQFAIFLGMLDALEAHGERPDLVIGTCGGAVAAAIATTIGSSAERRAFVESYEFFQILRSAAVRDAGLPRVLARLWDLNRPPYFASGLPNVFTDTLVYVPPRLPTPQLDKPFGASGIRAVIVAARVGFQPADVGMRWNGQKLYQQVFFTDPDTARSLRGFESPIARLFPDSAVSSETDVIPGLRPSVASRMGITDPFYVNPVLLEDGHYYLTGAIDLYPVETAQRLAKSVLMPFRSGFKSFVERKAVQNTFGYDNNTRLRYITSGFTARWIDTSDVERLYDRHGFDPRFHLWSLSVKSGVPESYERYRQGVRAQWEYGRARASEALKQPENSNAHIRVMDDSNTTRELRCRLGRENCQEPFPPGPNT